MVIGDWLPVAWNTPPSSMGLYIEPAPAASQMPGSCVQAR